MELGQARLDGQARPKSLAGTNNVQGYFAWRIPGHDFTSLPGSLKPRFQPIGKCGAWWGRTSQAAQAAVSVCLSPHTRSSCSCCRQLNRTHSSPAHSQASDATPATYATTISHTFSATGTTNNLHDVAASGRRVHGAGTVDDAPGSASWRRRRLSWW